MPINILGMIGVAPPAGGATVHVIGGGRVRRLMMPLRPLPAAPPAPPADGAEPA